MRKRAGFTLIELLVVVAIIAVLISILIPSLKEAKEQARKVVCMSNLKQIGVLLQVYLDDNDSNLPSTLIGGGNRAYSADWGGWTGLGLLYSEGYMDNPGVFYCPSGTNRYSYNQEGWTNPPEYVNSTLMSYVYRNQVWGTCVVDYKKVKKFSKKSLISDWFWGANDYAVCDHDSHPGSGSLLGWNITYDGLGWNVLYLDWHVTYRTELIIPANPYWSTWGW